MKTQTFAALATLSLIITACGASTATKDSTSSALSSANSSLLVANTAMRDGVATYASPEAGGLTGTIYVEPRALMTSPDSQVTGCDQRGGGALGIDAYLNQPAWASQQMLLTDLYVPTRNFTLGFPTPAAFGATQLVQSFFVMHATGYFHLKPGEPEGDYQFALIADDGARLKINVNDTAITVVDDQKPAGPNGSCLEQTQASHMSCTSNWSQQTAANVRTIHIMPGDFIPFDLAYWQGPGQELSMMAFYKLANSASPIDASCGQELGFAEGSAALTDVETRWQPINFNNLSADIY